MSEDNKATINDGHQEIHDQEKPIGEKEVKETKGDREAKAPMSEPGVRYYKKQEKNNRLKKNLMIFTCIIGGLIIIGLVGNSIKTSIFGTGEDYAASGPYIATIYVEGSIMSGQADSFGLPVGYQHQWTLDKMDDLMADPENRGLILFIDSPGGGIYESDELYLKLKEYKDHTNRPIYAVMGSMAASGGYYIAAAADEIIANRNTWTGSIGVTIGTLYDISELLDRYGIKTDTITSGDNKAMGSITDPMTEEQKRIFQSLVDEAYEQFVGIVAEERDIDVALVKEIADGRIYSAKQALELGLVDSIGTKEEAIALMSEEYDLWGFDIIDIIYRDHSFWGSILKGAKIPNLAGGDVTALLEVIDGNHKFPISYNCNLLNP